ncbi:MAG: tetratricopeptide repeat protein [Alphaproteobacteria bacterium]|nr:tetratricopeptide repeat protein [Alphaproteobacteria bacterium]
MLPTLLLPALLVVACGGARKAQVRQPPAWSTEEGKDQARIDIADALARNGSSEAALKMVAELRGEDLDPYELDLIQARALRDIGLTDDAEALLLAVVKKRPREARAHDQLGVLYMDLHRFDDALVHLRKAVTLASDDPKFRNNLGFALMTAGHADEAVPELREALRLDAGNDQVRNNLGFALVADGREDEAMRVFRAGQRESDAHYNLGLGLELRGETDAAVREYAAALDSEPTHAPAMDALRRLRPQDLHRLSPNPPLHPAPVKEEP